MTEIYTNTSPSSKAESAFRTISEVAEELGVQQHVLRFWETKFTQVKPMKRGGGRRYYRPEDVALLKKIHTLLYAEGYTIKGVQKLLKGVSKSQVLAEQKSSLAHQTTKAFGNDMPKVEGPAFSSGMPEKQAGTQPATSAQDEQVLVLKAVLDELLEMRAQVAELLAERDSEAA